MVLARAQPVLKPHFFWKGTIFLVKCLCKIVDLGLQMAKIENIRVLNLGNPKTYFLGNIVFLVIVFYKNGDVGLEPSIFVCQIWNFEVVFARTLPVPLCSASAQILKCSFWKVSFCYSNLFTKSVTWARNAQNRENGI